MDTNSISDIWQLLTGLPLQQLIVIVTGTTTVLAAVYGLGCWVTTQSHRAKEITLQSQITKLEHEITRLREMPTLSVTLSGDDDAIRRFGHFLRYSFVGSNPVHPRILEEFYGWLADSGAPIIAMDIEAAIRSNKYCSPIEFINLERGEQWVRSSNEEERSFFQYRHLGSSPTGINAVLIAYNGGGSGTFYSILFLVFQSDSYLQYEAQGKKRDRVLLKCIGHLSLGDRYDGEVQFKNGQLLVGKRVNWWPEYRPESEVIIIE
jgi:hypothetical protein